VVFFINDFEIQQYDAGYCIFVKLITLTWPLVWPSRRRCMIPLTLKAWEAHLPNKNHAVKCAASMKGHIRATLFASVQRHLHIGLKSSNHESRAAPPIRDPNSRRERWLKELGNIIGSIYNDPPAISVLSLVIPIMEIWRKSTCHDKCHHTMQLQSRYSRVASEVPISAHMGTLVPGAIRMVLIIRAFRHDRYISAVSVTLCNKRRGGAGPLITTNGILVLFDFWVSVRYGPLRRDYGSSRSSPNRRAMSPHPAQAAGGHFGARWCTYTYMTYTIYDSPS
jgi:hypothetical protein